MKCITCEERPTEGDVYIDGFNISDMSRALVPVLRRQIGMIYQDFRLIETKTVFENIAFAGEIIGIPKKSLAQTVQLVLNIVGLKDKADAYPQELSGGEQQRVAIARAMVNNPKLIVADEPTGNLDPETSENIMAILQEINRSGSTVVVCTHDSNLVDRMQKRVIEIDGGLIARDEEDSKYSHEEKPEQPEFQGYGIENPGFAFGDDPNFKEDAEYSDSFDDEGYTQKQEPAFFFGETPPEVIAAQKAAEAKAAEEAAKAAAALAAAKALEEADMPEEIPMLDDEEIEALESETAAEEKDASEETVSGDDTVDSLVADVLEQLSDDTEDKPVEEEAEVSDADAPEDASDEEPEISDAAEEAFEEESQTEETDEAVDSTADTADDKQEEETAGNEEDWIEEISLSDIDLDIQEDDD